MVTTGWGVTASVCWWREGLGDAMDSGIGFQSRLDKNHSSFSHPLLEGGMRWSMFSHSTFGFWLEDKIKVAAIINDIDN